MWSDTETLSGILQTEPTLSYTHNGKALCKAKFETEDEQLTLVAWEENAHILNSEPKGSELTIEGYRKYNEFNKREEFQITSIE